MTAAPTSLPRVQDVSINPPVLAFGAVTALLAALAVALVPARRVGRGDLEFVLRSGGSTSGGGAVRIRSLLVTTQVALSVMLLVVSGRFVSRLRRLPAHGSRIHN